MKTQTNQKITVGSHSLYCNKIGCETDGEAAYGVDTIFGTVWFCSHCASVIQNVWSGHTQNK